MGSSEAFRPHAVVVGAGLIGSAMAWRLSQQGWRVTVLEAKATGAGASSAGAGMLAPGGELFADSPWATLLRRSAKLYPAFVEELQEESGCLIDLRRCGGVDVAHSQEEWAALQQRAERQRTFGIDAESLPLSHVPAAAQQAALVGAMHYPDDAVVDPVQVLRALRIACERNGVLFVEQQPVQRIRQEGDRVWVDGREVDSAIVAAGAWSAAITIDDFTLPPVYPVRGHILGYDLPAGLFGPILRHGHLYVFQRSTGWTVAGASMERVGFDETIVAETGKRLDAQAHALLPQALAGVEPAKVWIGFRPGTPDDMPVQQRLPGTNILLAYGHYRNGILAAPAVAEWGAAALSHAVSA